MPPKKEKGQQPAIIRTIAKACSEKFWYHFSELFKSVTFVRVLGKNFGELLVYFLTYFLKYIDFLYF
jgi:hypothetical protein